MKSAGEAAKILGVSHRRVTQLIESGQLEAEKVGGVWLVDDASVAARAARGRSKGGRPRKGSTPHEHVFIWMNRTHPLARVIYDSRSHEFTSVGDLQDPQRVPIGLANGCGGVSAASFNSWWRHRGIPEGRAGVDRILEQAGVTVAEELSERGLGLSLSDQYWICPEGSGLAWEDVNFFANGFGDCSPVMAEGGEFRHPDNTSEGELPKHWVTRDGKRLLLKGTGASGQEPFNEVVATALYRRLLDRGDFVVYELGEWGGRPASCCEVFVSDEEEYVPAVYVSSLAERPAHRSEYQHYLDCCHELGAEGVEGALSRMIVCDDLLANTDRHWRNFGLVRNVETLECRVAPIFDSGTSLWCTKPLIDLRRGDYSFESRQFYSDVTRQFQLADLIWVDVNALDGFLEEAMGILGRGEGLEGRIPFIRQGLSRRIERLTVIREWL